MNRVLAMVGNAHDQAHLRGALRGDAELFPFPSANDILASLAEHSAVAVVVAAYGPHVAEAIGLTRALRARHPSVPVLIYYDPQYTNPRDLLSFFHAGAAEILQAGSDDLRRVMASILSSAGHRVKARLLVEHLQPVLPPQTQRLIEYLIEHGNNPLSIDEAASAAGIARRTLEKRLANLGWPPPETLIGWCRLLVAAQFLEDQGRTFDDVALELGFPSGMALRMMLKRYTGVPGRRARAHGPVALILGQLTEQLDTPQAAEAMRKSRTSDGTSTDAVDGKD